MLQLGLAQNVAGLETHHALQQGLILDSILSSVFNHRIVDFFLQFSWPQEHRHLFLLIWAISASFCRVFAVHVGLRGATIAIVLLLLPVSILEELVGCLFRVAHGLGGELAHHARMSCTRSRR